MLDVRKRREWAEGTKPEQNDILDVDTYLVISFMHKSMHLFWLIHREVGKTFHRHKPDLSRSSSSRGRKHATNDNSQTLTRLVYAEGGLDDMSRDARLAPVGGVVPSGFEPVGEESGVSSGDSSMLT